MVFERISFLLVISPEESVDLMRLSPGVKFGRKKSLTDAQVVEMRQKRTDGLLIKDLMTHYGLSKASVYRALGAGGDVLE